MAAHSSIARRCKLATKRCASVAGAWDVIAGVAASSAMSSVRLLHRCRMPRRAAFLLHGFAHDRHRHHPATHGRCPSDLLLQQVDLRDDRFRTDLFGQTYCRIPMSQLATPVRTEAQGLRSHFQSLVRFATGGRTQQHRTTM